MQMDRVRGCWLWPNVPRIKRHCEGLVFTQIGATCQTRGRHLRRRYEPIQAPPIQPTVTAKRGHSSLMLAAETMAGRSIGRVKTEGEAFQEKVETMETHTVPPAATAERITAPEVNGMNAHIPIPQSCTAPIKPRIPGTPITSKMLLMLFRTVVIVVNILDVRSHPSHSSLWAATKASSFKCG